MLISDPYPEGWPADLTPVRLSFAGARTAGYSYNLLDPQPPGYRFRLPRFSEFDRWISSRRACSLTSHGATGIDFSPWPIRDGSGWACPPLTDPRFQGVNYYQGGMWHHAGGSVYCWCGDHEDQEGNQMTYGGAWSDEARNIRTAHWYWPNQYHPEERVGYRMVRGPQLC